MEAELLEKFKSVLKNRYIFHLHTVYTDGSSSVEDYCRWASNNKFDGVVFVEHTRRKLSYDFNSFLRDVEIAKREFPHLDIWVGSEAKIIPGGQLDIPDSILARIKLVCFACHSFPDDIELYHTSFKTLFKDKRWKEYLRCWVHPGRFLKNRGFLDKNWNILEDLIEVAIKEEIFIENNLKDKLLPHRIIIKIPPSKLITGYDVHSVEEISKLEKVVGKQYK
jgi:putative hydrolase